MTDTELSARNQRNLLRCRPWPRYLMNANHEPILINGNVIRLLKCLKRVEGIEIWEAHLPTQEVN